jgi:hypothetical protein
MIKISSFCIVYGAGRTSREAKLEKKLEINLSKMPCEVTPQNLEFSNLEIGKLEISGA